MPEYYPDIAFLVNFFADYILLYLTGRIRQRKVKAARLCLSAAAGSLAAVAMTAWFGGGGFAAAGFLLGGAAMCAVAFGTRGMGGNLLALFFCTFVMGGMLYAAGAFLPESHILTQVGGNKTYMAEVRGTKRWLVPTAFLLSIFTISAAALLLVIRMRRENAARPIYPVQFFIGETAYQCRGLLDTGNGLYDPFRKKPVLVLAAPEFQLPPEEFCKKQPEKARYIPYRAVGTKEGILCGAELSKVTIEAKGQEICLTKIPAVYAQLSAQGRGYEVILHPDFFRMEFKTAEFWNSAELKTAEFRKMPETFFWEQGGQTNVSTIVGIGRNSAELKIRKEKGLMLFKIVLPNKFQLRFRPNLFHMLFHKRGEIHYIGGAEILPAPLTPSQESDVLLLLGTVEDATARAILAKHNLRLVVYIAKKFDNTGVGVEDLISIGTIGLMKAINTFNPEKKIKFATYASRCIENEILMYLRRNNKLKQEVSIDEPLNVDWDGNELLLSDILGTEEDGIYRSIEAEADKKQLYKALEKLDEREKIIVKLRFGIGTNDGRERTQKEVADLLGISQSYISRLEKKIMKRLKKEMSVNGQ